MGDMKKRGFENLVGGSSHGAGDGDDNKIRRVDNEEGQFQEGHNFYPNTDSRNLEEIIASQGSSQKKAQNVVELEMQVEALQGRIGFLYSQIGAYENKKLSLLNENEAMKLQLIAEEKERVLREVEILKNMEELIKLNGLTRVQADALMQMIGHNSNASSNQAQNGEELRNEAKSTEEKEMH